MNQPGSRWLPRGLPFAGMYVFFLLSVLWVSSQRVRLYRLSVGFRDRVVDVDLLGPRSMFDIVEYR